MRSVGYAVVIAAVLAISGFALNSYLLDGLDGTLFALCFQEDTEFAKGYTDASFRDLSLGMTSAEVLRRLGEPLDTLRLDGGRISWRYARSKADHSYRVRAILFEGDRVIQVFHEFYVD